MAAATTLSDLLDRQVITDILIAYARGADRGDVDLIEAAYHEDAIEDHGGTYKGPARDYVALMRKMLPRAPRMSHSVTNILVELEGDTAWTECHYLTFARLPVKDGKPGETVDSLTMARAIDRFERRDGRWAIAHRRLAWDWSQEMPTNESWGRGLIAPDPSVLVRGTRKPDDVLYRARAEDKAAMEAGR